jgi:hypothetical protein
LPELRRMFPFWWCGCTDWHRSCCSHSVESYSWVSTKISWRGCFYERERCDNLCHGSSPEMLETDTHSAYDGIGTKSGFCDSLLIAANLFGVLQWTTSCILTRHWLPRTLVEMDHLERFWSGSWCLRMLEMSGWKWPAINLICSGSFVIPWNCCTPNTAMFKHFFILKGLCRPS